MPVQSVNPLQTGSKRLFIIDKNSNISYLVDSGSVLSIIPKKLLPERREKSSYILAAANNSEIYTYGTITLTLNLGLRRDFTWTFVVADIPKAIIGADFLSEFNLLVDVRQQTIIDKVTNLSVRACTTSDEIPIIKTISGTSIYHDLLREFPEITRPSGTHKVIKHNTKHFIETTPGPPISSRPRRLSTEKLIAAKKEFEILLKQGIIRPSKSPWSSPLHLVKKSDGGWRATGDYRLINARTIDDAYGLKYLTDFSQTLDGKTIFSEIDLVRAFHQIPMAEEDIPKTAITTPFGLYEYLFMGFGLKNSSSTFQRFLDEVLRDLDFCYSYVDNILVASSSAKEHLEHLRIVFSRLSKYGLIINPSKCNFGQTNLNFLGYNISADGIKPQAEKVEAILKIPLPQTAKQVRQMIGALNFYRQHIPGMANIQAPLNDMLKGNLKKSDRVTWTNDTLTSFEACKQSLANASLLHYPKIGLPFVLHTDASDRAISGVLQQLDGDALLPLSFFSKKLSPAEQKYSTYDRELLAIYRSIKFFEHYLEGRTFTIYTDHLPLTFAFKKKTKQCSPRQFRYLDYIGQFSTDIRHISGSENQLADLLSRIYTVNSPAINWKELAISQQNDETLKDLLKSDSTSLKFKLLNFIDDDDTKIYCDVSTTTVRPYITEPFRQTAFNSIHNLSHPGARTTCKLLTKRFVWKSINKDCKQMARNCIQCQQSKITRHVKTKPGVFKLPSTRFEHIHMDIIHMPYSEGYRYCLTITDRFTRWPEAIPIQDMQAETVARAFYDNWICRFGTPLKITTDRGRNFQSHLFKELNILTGVTHLKTTSFHPISNGAIERIHRQLKAAIRCHQNNQWTKILPTVLYGMRNAFKEDLQATPADMLYGQSLSMPGDFFSNQQKHITGCTFADELRKHFYDVRPTAGTSHNSENNTFVFKDLNTCSHVFVRIDRPKKMLELPYSGPFKVLQRNDKYFTIDIRGKPNNVSLDRLKPVYQLGDPHVPITYEGTAICPRTNLSSDTSFPITPQDTLTQQPPLRRSNRKIRFPQHFQAGFP